MHPQEFVPRPARRTRHPGRWARSCSTPTFRRLYPNTPIFDGGRVGELFLLLGGGTYQPAAYKIGFAVLCVAVPFFLLVAGISLGLGNLTTLLATFLGQLVWWGPHGRGRRLPPPIASFTWRRWQRLAACRLAHCVPSVGECARLAWALAPPLRLGLVLAAAFVPTGGLPVLLAYYLSVGTKHEFLTWHFALWFAEIFALVVNLPWLVDWFDSWWLRAALPTAPGLLEHRTLHTLWNAPIWGGPPIACWRSC